MKTMTLRPKAGLVVRDPETRAPLAEAGETKPATPYWLRRLRDGDVEQVRRTPLTKAAAKRQQAKADTRED